MNENILFASLQADRTKAADALDSFSLRGIKNVITDLTQGEAHFVYELLQNADDARATEIRFQLLPEGLAVWHNAPDKFTLSDVRTEPQDVGTPRLGHLNAITSIGNSTKRQTENPAGADTIGRFGIGFKSVFQYTRAPHFYEAQLSFRIERIVVPVQLFDTSALPAGISRSDDAQTLLWLPFDHAERSAAEAHAHVLGRLSGLRLPLLFLRHLASISWEACPYATAPPSHSGLYMREPAQPLGSLAGGIVAEYVEMAEENVVPLAGPTTDITSPRQRFVVVKQPCLGYPKLWVCLAFPLRDDGSLDTAADERGYEAFCYFNTRHATGLRFLIQAPWLLTNNREAIKADQEWNRELVQQLAQLLADCLPLLRDLGPLPRLGKNPAAASSLLTDDLLQLLPLSGSSDHERRSTEELDRRRELSFRPFHEAVLRALKQERLLPTSIGGHCTAKEAYFAESQALSRVFGPEQLRQLINNEQAEWVFDSVGGKEDKAQTDYLTRLLSSDRMLDPKAVAAQLGKKFMERQTDDWLTSFYLYLEGPSYLLDGQNAAILRYRGDILRLEDGSHASPYTSAKDSVLRVHLPPSIGSDVIAGARTLKACFAQSEELASFRRRLGLTEPTHFTVLTDYILPLYAHDEVDLPAAVHQAHMQQLLDCWRTSSPDEQTELRWRLENLAFIGGTAHPQNDNGWYRPDEIYLATADLRVYFAPAEAVFVDETFYGELMSGKRSPLAMLLQELGVATVPRIISMPDQPVLSEDTQQMWKVRSTWTSEQTVTNHDLDGLEAFLHQPDIRSEQSIVLFNYLSIHISESNSSLFERQYTFGFYGPNTVRTPSKALTALQQTAWLVDNTGQTRLAYEFAQEGVELADYYDVDRDGAARLLQHLGIVTDRQKTLSGLASAERELLRLYREMKRQGASDEEMQRVLAGVVISSVKGATSQPEVPSPEDVPVSTADYERQRMWQGQRETNQAGSESSDTAFGSTTTPADTTTQTASSEEPTDPNELSWASAEKLRRARKQLDELEDALREQHDLARAAQDAEPYTYGWFLAMLQLEMLLSNHKDEKASAFSLSFAQIAFDPHSPQLLLLREPAGYISRTVEDFPNLKLRLYLRDNQPPRTIPIDVVSVKDFTLRARLSAVDLASIDPDQVKRASIQVQSPEFLLDRLLAQFQQLAKAPYHFQPDDNLRQRLPANLRFVFGPPGTGKTYHLAHHEIERLMQADQPWRVLVLTPTNKAADVLTARLLSPPADPELPPVCPPWLVRYGHTADNALEQVPFLVRDRSLFDPADFDRCTLITTAARFPYAEGNDGQRLADLGWDYVVLDEASMIPLYQAVNIIYQLPHCQEFIIGGDPLQIPPVVYAEPWAGQNIYTLVGLHDFVHPTTTPHNYPVERLMMQRRATPPLGRLFSEYAYGGLLTHARPLLGQHVASDGTLYEGRRELPLGSLTLGDITIVRFPVRKGEGPFEARKMDQGSNYHAYSALLAAELVRYLGAQAAGNASCYRAGIISPYAAQTTLLREVIKQLPQTELVVNVNEDIGTVHGFQGDECHLVIALLGTPPTTGAGIMLNLPHILNVAVSRARDRLVLFVPDYQDERASGTGLTQLRRLLALAIRETEGTVVELTAAGLEQQLFGQEYPDYILNNSFFTSHQLVNVYGQGILRYELRFGSAAIDVQVNLQAKPSPIDNLN